MKYLFKTESGYTYDRRIFWSIIGLVLLILGILVQQGEIDIGYYFYFKCERDSCPNPLIDTEVKNAVTNYDYKKQCTEEWCTEPILARGEYGRKPPAWIKKFPFIIIVMVLLGLILNHYWHNKGKKIDLSLNIPKSWKDKLSKL